MLQCVAVLHTVACRVRVRQQVDVLQHVAACCSVLQCVTVCYSVLQCVAVCCSVLQCVVHLLQCIVNDSSDKSRSAQDKLCSFQVFCSVLQCVAVCCSMLQC